MYDFAPFMVVTQVLGGPRPLYGGVYTVGEHGHGVYFLEFIS
jgi:hypothetical protein